MSRVYKNLTECILDLYIISVRNQTLQDGMDRNISPRDEGIISLYLSGCTELVQGCTVPKTYDTLIRRLHSNYNKLFPDRSSNLTNYIKRVAASFIPTDYSSSMGLNEAHQMTHQVIMRLLKNCMEICTPHVRAIMDGKITSNSDIYVAMTRSTYTFLDQLQAESTKRLMGNTEVRGEQSIDPAVLESMKIELRKALEEKFKYKHMVQELEQQIAQLQLLLKTRPTEPQIRSTEPQIRSTSPAVQSIIDLSETTIKSSDSESDEPEPEPTRKHKPQNYAALSAEIDEINL
jgi:hypothetical protein